MRRRKREGEEKKQATDFKEALCCTSGIVQGAAQRKNEAECPGYLGPSGRPTAILTQPKRSWRLHHHVEAAVDWSSVYCLRAYYYVFTIRLCYVLGFNVTYIKYICNEQYQYAIFGLFVW